MPDPKFNMNEQPTTFWRKPWRGVRGFFLWFGLLTSAAFVIFFCIGLLTTSHASAAFLLSDALIGAAGAALVVTLAIAFIRWLCCWRNVRRFLIGVVGIVTLVALFHAEENWRGKHAW